MGREIRRVPQNWQHPKRIVEKSNGAIEEVYRPMLGHTTFEEAVEEFHKELAEWMAGYRLWQEGEYKSYDGKQEGRDFVLERWANDLEKERKKYGFPDSYRAADTLRYTTGMCQWKDINGEPPRYPDPDGYFPSWPEDVATWFQVYETVSEGTPVSPPFATQAELVEYLVANGDFWDQKRRKEGRGGIDCDPWTREQAERFVYGSGWTPSLIVASTANGTEVADGVRANY